MDIGRGSSEAGAAESPAASFPVESKSSSAQPLLDRMHLPIPNQTEFSLISLAEALAQFGGTRGMVWKTWSVHVDVRQLQQHGEQLIDAIDTLAAEQNACWLDEQYTQLLNARTNAALGVFDLSAHDHDHLEMCIRLLENCLEPQQCASMQGNLRLHFAYLMDIKLGSAAIRRILLAAMDIDHQLVTNATFQLLARRNHDINDHEFLEHFREYGGDPSSIQPAENKCGQGTTQLGRSEHDSP